MVRETDKIAARSESVTLFLCGDVMIGRGIDQILPEPSDPGLYESYVKTATRYLELAEAECASIPRPADLAYPWGNALQELERVAPDARIVNLETAVTQSNDYWRRKTVHYRMHPANVGCLSAAKIDCCALANNHVLDWGYAGLEETLATLKRAGLGPAGAGKDLAAAVAPAFIDVPGKRRVLVFSCGAHTSGIPHSWAATHERAGINLLKDLSNRAVQEVAQTIEGQRRHGDIVVLSIHWGGNWGYHIADDCRSFAHRVIDDAGVDVVHGHSSHHPKGIEIYRNRPILYGCGDFVNDYEGISGHEEFRGDLALMYFVVVSTATGELIELEMTPLQIRQFKLNYASDADGRWLCDRMNAECGRFGHYVEAIGSRPFTLRLVDP